MAFQPLKSGTVNSALFGAIEPSKFINIDKYDKTLYDEHVHPIEEKKSGVRYTIIIIIISAIIFVTIISIYDVFRSLIKNYYAKMALNNPQSDNNIEDINRTIIANRDELIAYTTFSILCIITSIIIIYIIVKFVL